MKRNLKVSLMVIAVLATGLLIHSCKKEESVLHNTSLKGSASRGIDCIERGMDTRCDGTLHFVDIDQYERVYACLEAEYESYSDDFETTHTFVDDDQWSDLMDSLNFNEDAPLIDFESYFTGYISARKYFTALEDAWANTYNCDTIHDPDSLDLFGDNIESTLWNQYNQVIIGDSLYMYLSDGTLLAMKTPGCDTLKDLRTNPAAAIKLAGTTRTVYPALPGTDVCSRTAYNKRSVYYASNNAMLKLKHRCNFKPWSVKEKATTVSFRKRHGSWKKRRVSLHVDIDGAEASSACSDDIGFTPVKEKHRRRLKVKYPSSGFYLWKIINQRNVSTHSASFNSNSVSDTLVLYW